MEPLLGQIVLLAYDRTPRGWAACEGQILAVSQNVALFRVIGNRFGGDGRQTFALPDLRSKAPEGLTYFIATAGLFPG